MGDRLLWNFRAALEISGQSVCSSEMRIFSVSCERFESWWDLENRWKKEAHVRDRGIFDARIFFLLILLFAPVSLLIGVAGCSSPAPTQPAPGPQRYALSGRVVSVDKAKLQVVVDAANIPGFMMAMTMGYAVKSPNLLDPLSPEDQITADVVVNGTDVYLENIVVIKKADQAKTPASSDAHPAVPKPDKK
jgi:hypothetical protein